MSHNLGVVFSSIVEVQKVELSHECACVYLSTLLCYGIKADNEMRLSLHQVSCVSVLLLVSYVTTL